MGAVRFEAARAAGLQIEISGVQPAVGLDRAGFAVGPHEAHGHPARPIGLSTGRRDPVAQGQARVAPFGLAFDVHVEAAVGPIAQIDALLGVEPAGEGLEAAAPGDRAQQLQPQSVRLDLELRAELVAERHHASLEADAAFAHRHVGVHRHRIVGLPGHQVAGAGLVEHDLAVDGRLVADLRLPVVQGEAVDREPVQREPPAAASVAAAAARHGHAGHAQVVVRGPPDVDRGLLEGDPGQTDPLG